MPPIPDTCTRPQVAALLGVSARRVSQLVAEGVLPTPTAHGRYDLVMSVRALIAWWKCRALHAEHLVQAGDGPAADGAGFGGESGEWPSDAEMDRELEALMTCPKCRRSPREEAD